MSPVNSEYRRCCWSSAASANDRARSFAVAALDQLQGRYSLMTGDIGAALFAQACIDVDPRFPILDVV